MCAVLQERGNLGCFTRLSHNVKQTAPFELMELDLLTPEQKILVLPCLGQVMTIKLPAFCQMGLSEEEQTACSGSFWGSEASLNSPSEVPSRLFTDRAWAGNLLSFNQEWRRDGML